MPHIDGIHPLVEITSLEFVSKPDFDLPSDWNDEPKRIDYYLKQVFSHTRRLLNVSQDNIPKRLPQLLTDAELAAFYDAVFSTRNPTHMVMIKLLIFTGIRNAELAKIRLTDVDLTDLMIRIERGKGKKDRFVPIPLSFRGELAHYIESQRKKKAVHLFESNRKKPDSTRRIRQIVKQYASQANIEKRVYPHLFRHQLITFLTKLRIISPKLQLISGHSAERNLAIYRDLALGDVATEYQQAMKTFPVQ
jgi:integrase/recombinase XerD